MIRPVLVAAAAGLALAGCGAGSKHSVPDVRIAAASSLTGALTACAPHIPAVHAQVEFGGSDQLAAQIRQGVGIDVFAAANTKLPAALAAEHRAGAPVDFATNELVLAVPGDSPLRSLRELSAHPSTPVAIGAASVPVGAYTREVLGRLPPAESAALRAQVRSEEPDVKGIVGKLVAGAVGAGFVYRTDVLATDGRLRAIALPRALRPTVVYGVAPISHGAGSAAVITDLLHGGCAGALRSAGFGAPPA